MSTKVTTATPVRLSYTNLLEPRAANAEKPDVLTYSTAILIPKSDTATLEAINASIKEALVDGISKKWGGKTPPNLKNPMRDGDTDRPDDETYKGMMFINAKGPRGGAEKAILFDKTGTETVDPTVIYSGVQARVSIQFYAFDKQGNKGVAAGVTSVLSLETGDSLGAAVTPNGERSEFGITTPAGDAAAAFAAPAAAAGEESDPWTS